MRKNNIRFDLSNWLIHFFRDINLEKDNISMPEQLAPFDFSESDKYPAFFLLRSAIKQLKIWAGKAYRNFKPTIYGPYPAVCFTEMPIAAFIQAGRERRKNGECMSPLALLFDKCAMFDLGARPVIYDLFPINGGYIPDQIDPKILNIEDQYRYVRFNLSSERNIDWSHEREWRWAFRNIELTTRYESKIQKYGLVSSYKDVPGLSLLSKINNIGIIVETQEQADYIISDLILMLDRKIINKDKFSFIIVADKINSNLDVTSPQKVNELIKNSLIDPLNELSLSDADLKYYTNQFHSIISTFNETFTIPKNVEKELVDEYGSCWLWIYDRKHKLTRALLEIGTIKISKGGRYLVGFDRSYKTTNLKKEEYRIKELSKIISSQFNIECGYFTILGNGVYDPSGGDDIPFYCDPPLDDNFIYNKNLYLETD